VRVADPLIVAVGVAVAVTDAASVRRADGLLDGGGRRRRAGGGDGRHPSARGVGAVVMSGARQSRDRHA
jgi:hypothetical protein